MGRYMRKCKGVTGEIAVLEVATEHSTRRAASQGGVTTRSQAALANEKKNRRRRSRTDVNDGEFSWNAASFVCTRRRMLMIQSAPTSTLNTSTFQKPAIRGVLCSVENINDLDPQPALCCSPDASGEVFENRMDQEAADPTAERGGSGSCKLETSTTSDAISERREMVESRIPEESGDLKNSTARMTTEADSGSSEPKVMMEMPSKSEIEEFFVAAEKDLQKRFSEKYNFDIVRDVPLEGRYEWVQVKP